MHLVFTLLLAVLGTSYADDWRVTRGRAAVAGELPWVAHIQGGGCTASIINAFTVLTAGHCVCNNRPASIVVGALRTSGNTGVRVANITVHPLYPCGRVHPRDVAVVKLAQPIPFTQFIQPIQVNCTKLVGNTKVFVMGYGRDELGRSGVLNWAESGIDSIRSDGMLVSLERSFPSHILPGDSGGPVTFKNGNSQTQVGVNSGGGYNLSGVPGHTAFYAPIADNCDFIRPLL